MERAARREWDRRIAPALPGSCRGMLEFSTPNTLSPAASCDTPQIHRIISILPEDGAIMMACTCGTIWTKPTKFEFVCGNTDSQ